jgi:hypothetical protein
LSSVSQVHFPSSGSTADQLVLHVRWFVMPIAAICGIHLAFACDDQLLA